MTRRALCMLGIVVIFGCTSSSEPEDVQTSSESSNTHTVTTSGSTTSSSSSSLTSPSSTSETLHDSGERPTTPGDTGRPDSGWFTLPGPGFDSATYTMVGDTQDTG
jgi:hypothetical protein